MHEEEEILDLPDREEDNRKEFKLIRIASLLLFILALLFRFMDLPGHEWLLIGGATAFLMWSVLRFTQLPRKSFSEIVYLPARFLLIGGLTIRYTVYWPFDKCLVYSGLFLFLVGLLATFRDR